MFSFNCYGYAVGIYGLIDPGFSTNDTYDISEITVAQLADKVRQDLKSTYLDQNCVRVTTACPSYSNLGTRQAICI